MALSPMMQQYTEIKEQYKDAILFFRLGDFYEMFFDDALLVSKELELTLTGKNCGLEERAPMCGVPFHSSETYIGKLIEKGYKVAICEQTEDPATTKGLVKRDVVQVVTPGTLTSSSMLDEKENNYFASVYYGNKGIGFSYCDISTGELYATEISGVMAKETLYNELTRIHAKEIIINQSADVYLDFSQMEELIPAYYTYLEGRYYERTQSKKMVLQQLRSNALSQVELDEKPWALLALGAQLTYLGETQMRAMEHLLHLNRYTIGNHMALDKATIRNLELTETLLEKKREGSLLGLLDKTHTAMGSRKMKKWLGEPLNQREEIVERLDSVELLVEDPLKRNHLKESLKAIYDFERLSAKVACGTANGRDLIALRNSLYVIPEIKMDLQDTPGLLGELEQNIHPLTEVFTYIDQGITEEPPYTVKEGGLIKEGYSRELDQLKDSIKDAKIWIAGLAQREKERTGISNLKVGYNKVFGYYIEVSKSQYDKVPENYIRKQTLTSGERFITPELKEMETRVLHAETKIHQKEYEIFVALREEIKKYLGEIQKTSAAIGHLDVLVAFADVSDKLGYQKPVMTERDEIEIVKGRHPVVEQTLEAGTFVSNDTYMDRDKNGLLLITGPNMAGKSTYMRQTAILVLMAQAGCFIPCERASIGVVDRIFTRIGASDNLAAGQSTFFVEMTELAYILNTATQRSLVILDEIGRGTSTYDGLSIAWAVAEYLCEKKRKIRTLFATHYHELTALGEKNMGLKNLNVDVAEENGTIVFLYKIMEGSASESYGIHVAQLAGVPQDLLDRANEKLTQLEQNSEELSNEEGIQLAFGLGR